MSHILYIWIRLGIIACIALSALFAGLNLAIFSLSQLRLQLEADGGNEDERARSSTAKKTPIKSSSKRHPFRYGYGKSC